MAYSRVRKPGWLVEEEREKVSYRGGCVWEGKSITNNIFIVKIEFNAEADLFVRKLWKVAW